MSVLQRLLEALPQALLIVDEHTRVVAANDGAAHVLAPHLDRLPGHNLGELIEAPAPSAPPCRPGRHGAGAVYGRRRSVPAPTLACRVVPLGGGRHGDLFLVRLSSVPGRPTPAGGGMDASLQPLAGVEPCVASGEVLSSAEHRIHELVAAAARLAGPGAGDPEPGSALLGPLAEVAPPLGGVKILLVDDHAESRLATAAMLAACGAAVADVGSGREGLDEIRREPPDLVVSDLQMPGEDGMTLVRKLHRIALPRRVPAVAVTACGEPDICKAALEAGFDALLSKPVQLDELLGVIRCLLAR